MAAYRYFRLKITTDFNNIAGNAAEVKDIAFNDTPFGANICVGGVAFSTPSYYTPDAAFGGSSYVWYADYQEPYPIYIGYDVGAGNETDAQQVYVSTPRGLGQTIIQTSVDGVTWVDRATIPRDTVSGYFPLSASPNVAPVITSNGGGATASINYPENGTGPVTTVTATDADDNTLIYSISGMDDGRFTINSSTGELNFITPPDYESPTDAGQVNQYHINVIASDDSASDSQALTVIVTNTDVVITSHGGASSVDLTLAENIQEVTTVIAEGAVYSITPGDDAALFEVDSITGVLSFINAPDYENPQDIGLNNVYRVTVIATIAPESAQQSFLITITDVPNGSVDEPHLGTNWTLIVTLDGIDVSSKITGNARVEGEESTSRIASFLYQPSAGTISAGDWLGVSVTIDYKKVDGIGNTLSINNIFTGIVDQALYDPITQLTAFDCTDDMQGKLEAMIQPEIDALILGSRYSTAVFGEYKDGWLYFENVIATTPKSYDFNADGVTGTLVNWAAKLTPDFSFDSSKIIDNSISYSIAPRRDLFNSYTIDYSYRFTRLHHRSHQFNWELRFCPYFARPHELPTKDMIRSAINSAGWAVMGAIDLSSLIPAAGNPCGDGLDWSISESDRDLLALGAKWKASKRWDQEITENYTLTIQAPQSITWLGEVAYSEQASNQTDFDSSGWSDGNTTPSGRINSIGDVVQDKFSRATSDNDITTLIARAKTEILESHRANHVVATVLLVPTLERFHTVRLDADGVVGQGKVFKLVHDMDVDSGEATTTIDIAISLNGGASMIVDSAIAPPAAPNTDPESEAPESSTTLGTHIGGDSAGIVYDESWDGFTGNYSLTFGSPSPEQFYTRRFKVVTPAINQDSIDHVDAIKTQSYLFNIPNETLTITVS